MAFGLGTAGLGPDVFWRMTPRELAAVMRGRSGAVGHGPALTRAEFQTLRESFPDEECET